jgi:anti-sigma regulatory factor (Ser/Thr protein kinase)
VNASPAVAWRHSALDLRPLPSAVPSARLHARHVFREWGHAAIAPDGELIVSEFVTNAIAASLSLPEEAGPPPVRLRLTDRPRGVQIEVWDALSRMPQRGPDPVPAAEGGRGLVLVEALSTRWGAYPAAGGGKVVWATVTG